MKGKSAPSHGSSSKAPAAADNFEPDADDDDAPAPKAEPKKHGGKVRGDRERPRLDKRARGGKLTAHVRQSLPKSDFALPGHGSGPKGAGSGSYPIPDTSHARNALARVSQHGSPAEKAEVRRKVHAKFPDIGKASGGKVNMPSLRADDVKDSGKVKMAAARGMKD